MRQIMRSSLDYAGFAQLCGRSPIMREIMRAHNRIIPLPLDDSTINIVMAIIIIIIIITCMHRNGYFEITVKFLTHHHSILRAQFPS